MTCLQLFQSEDMEQLLDYARTGILHAVKDACFRHPVISMFRWLSAEQEESLGVSQIRHW